MAKGSSLSGEIVHFGALRFRVTGSGNLQLLLHSLDDVNSSQLSSIAMQTTTNKEPLVLANFVDQRGYLEFKTTVINETFSISKITVFIRPIATGYPQ